MFGFGKWKTEAWQGIVADKTKIDTSTSDGGDYTTYYLHVQMPTGNVERKKYSYKVWKQFEAGDAIEKRAGEKHPVKL